MLEDVKKTRKHVKMQFKKNGFREKLANSGAKAIVNARIDSEGHVITSGSQVFIGGNDSYVAMCHKCWSRAIKSGEKVK